MAWCGIRQFYAQPLAGAPKARAADAIPAGGAAVGVALSYRALLFHAAVLLLFAAAVLKLSAQSFSPFLYFQF
ncbi:hypothetical protein D3C71_2099860 [compost metagenome]